MRVINQCGKNFENNFCEICFAENDEFCAACFGRRFKCNEKYSSEDKQLKNSGMCKNSKS